MTAPDKRLDKVLTIPEVAAIAGWHRRRMLRHLLRLNQELGGMLLHNVGTRKKPRWTITLRALRAVAPAWFLDAEALHSRLEEVEGDVAQLKRIVALHGKAIDQLVA